MQQVKAVIFGAIGVIAETSDLQRRAFNRAFVEAGLTWRWDVPTYRTLLAINGGQARLRHYRHANPDRDYVSDALIVTLHQRKTVHYVAMVNDGMLTPRPGVVELMMACRRSGVRTALCTSTSRDNVDALAKALGSSIDFADFASVTTIDQISKGKPAPDAYLHCLAQLALSERDVIAIEDTPVSMASATAAGIAVIATPGAMTNDQDFSAAAMIVSDLRAVSLVEIEAVLASALTPVIHA